MKKSAAILTCKLLHAVGNLMGKGSSLPGEYALKICPDILNHLTLPEIRIAVTGSNGKTSTVEMMAKVLEASGKKVICNREGSNQIEGIVTLLLNHSSPGGKVSADILLMEMDERYTKHILKYFQPTHYVITNLYRDQLTRNGHPQWVYKDVAKSIGKDCTLLLNSDDPLVSLLAEGHDPDKVIWFGMDRQAFSTDKNTGMYDDGRYCPLCGAPLTYNFYHNNHIGHFHCTQCDFRHHDTLYTVTAADLNQGTIILNGTDRIDLAFKSLYNVYNILSCYAVCRMVGIPGKMIAETINDYMLKNGRIIQYRLGDAFGIFLLTKHESSIGYDQAIRYIVQQNRSCAVMIIVDEISRKHFTSDTSWLWDIAFDQLNTDMIEHIYLTGKYANDLYVRFSYTDIPKEKLSLHMTVSEGVEMMKKGGHRELYTMTCFADKDKFLPLVTIV